MNGFTKKELEELREAYQNYSSSGNCIFDFILDNKLQSMIDNYCPHDGEIGIDYPSEKCMKCGRLLG